MSQQPPPEPAPQLATFRFVEQAPGLRFALRSRSVMLALSHLIEEQAVGSETVLVATFQSLTRYRRQLARYRELGARLGAVYVVGVPDIAVEEVPNVTIVPIERGWPLAQEWVVLASGPTFCAGLLAREEQPFTLERHGHRFYGRLSTDPASVDTAIAAFGRAIGKPLTTQRHNARAIFDSSQRLLAQLRKQL